MIAIFLSYVIYFSSCITIRKISHSSGVADKGTCVKSPCRTLGYVLTQVSSNEDELILVENVTTLTINHNIEFFSVKSLTIESFGGITDLVFDGGSLYLSALSLLVSSELKNFNIIDKDRCGSPMRHFLMNLHNYKISNCTFKQTTKNIKRCFDNDVAYIKVKDVENSKFTSYDKFEFPVLISSQTFNNVIFENIANSEKNIFGNSTHQNCQYINCKLFFERSNINIITDSTFTGGVNIHIVSKNQMTIENCHFEGNEVSINVNNNAQVMIQNSVFSNVTNGLSFIVKQHSILEVKGTKFLDNAKSQQYFLQLYSDSKSSFEECIFRNTVADFLLYIDDSDLSIQSSNFYDMDEVKRFIECHCDGYETCNIEIDIQTNIYPYLNPIICDTCCNVNGGFCDIWYHQHQKQDFSWLVLSIVFFVFFVICIFGCGIYLVIYCVKKCKNNRMYNKLEFD